MKRFLTSSGFTKSKKNCEKDVDDPDSIPNYDKLKNHYLFDGEFYKIVSLTSNKLTAKCQLCHKTILGQINSTGNFLSHVKYKHSSMMSKLQANKDAKKSNISSSSANDALCTSTKSPAIASKQLKLQYAQTFQPKQISKQTIVNYVYDYIVQEMRPLITCQKPAFRRLIMGLTGITDTSLLPDTKVIRNELKLRYSSYMSMLTDLISKQTFICTTADIWSCNNKSYLGMTCHFLDESTFRRYSYILACRRIKGTHTFLNIAKVMNEITWTFKISNSKISHTVTDNATNFGKAFRTFSLQSQTTTISLPPIERLNNWFSSSDDESNMDNSDFDSEVDDMSDNVEMFNVATLFSNAANINNTDLEDDISLPEHLTCSAHTLNLIATTDVAKISDESFNKISKSVFSKLNLFWNLLSRSSVASDKVHEICNCKFPVPIITRWNSMFFAIQKVLAHKEKLLVVFDELKLNKLKSSEWTFVEEYCLVMEPLATSLDLIQGEKTCLLGYVAPTIIALRLKLIQSTYLIYCRPLAISIVFNLEKRFNYVFDLELPKSKPFILSTISLPKFKLGWIPLRNLAMCKKLFITECNLFNSIDNNADNNNSYDDDKNSDHEFYDILNAGREEISLLNNKCKNNKNTNLANVQALSFLDTKKKI